MSDELIFPNKGDGMSADNIIAIKDALGIFEDAVKKLSGTLKNLSGAEETAASKMEKLLNKLGIGKNAVAKLKDESITLAKAITKNAEQFENQAEKMDIVKKAIQDQLDLHKKYGEMVPKQLDAVAKKYNVQDSSVKSLSARFSTYVKAVNEVVKATSEFVDVLGDIGAISASTQKELQGMLGGVSTVAEGLLTLSTNPVAGTIQILTGAVKLAYNAFQFFAHQGVRNAIEEERNFIQISEETEEKIIKLSDTLDDSHASTSMYMGDIISGAKINKDNFEYYAYRTAEIIDDYKNKSLALTDVQDNIGKSFSLLLKEAEKLGTEGSKAMVKMIMDIRDAGLEIPEVQAYVNKRLNEGVQALNTYFSTFDTTKLRDGIKQIGNQLSSNQITLFKEIDLLALLKVKQTELGAASADVKNNWEFMESATLATFAGFQREGKSYLEIVQNMGGGLDKLSTEAKANGIVVSEAFKDILHASDFARDHEGLVNRITATNQLMSSLNDSASLTKRSFNSFGDQAVKQFNALIGAGLEEEIALQMLAPQLNKLNDYSSRYNVTLNDQTKSLIEKGRQGGLIATSEQDNARMMLDLMTEIAIALNATLPESVKRMRESTTQEFKNIVDAGEQLKFRINFDDVAEQLPQIVESVRGSLDKLPGKTGYELFEVPISQAKEYAEKWLPKIQTFIGDLNKQGINVDMTNLSAIPQLIDPFQKIMKQEYQLDVGTQEAKTAMEIMFQALSPVTQALAEPHDVNVDFNNAKAGVISLFDQFSPVINILEKTFGVKIDVEAAKKALGSVATPWDAFKKAVETTMGIKIDTAQVKTAITAVAKFFEPFAKGLKLMGIDFDVEGILQSLTGVKDAQDAVNASTKESSKVQGDASNATGNTAKGTGKLNNELDILAKKYNLLKTDSLEPTEMLNAETTKMLKVFEKYRGALDLNSEKYEKNAQGADNLRTMLKFQLDQYDRYKITAIPALQEAACAARVLSTSEMKAMGAANDLKAALGDISSDDMAALVKESLNLTEAIILVSKNMDKSGKDADKVRSAIEKNLDKYKDMKNVPSFLRDISIEWGLIDEKTGLSTKTLSDFGKSIGMLNVGDVSTEMEVFTRALELNAQQYKNNPELIEPMLKKMEELEKKAKQAGLTVPDAMRKNTTALEKTKYETLKMVEADKLLYSQNEKLKNVLKLTSEEIRQMTPEVRKAKIEEADMQEKTSKLTDGQKDLAKFLGISKEQLVKFYETTNKIGGALSDFAKQGAAVTGFLKDTKIVSGETGDTLNALFTGVGEVGAGFTELSTNPVGGAIKIIGGAIKTVTNLFKLFAGDGVGEAIDREREFIDISEEMEKKIRELEKTVGDTHAATSMLMNEIIKEADINNDNFAKYAQRTRDILADLDRGKLSIKDTEESMGKAFTELLSDAQKLGTEGSKEMIQLLGDVRTRGLEVAEMQDYVNEKLNSGVKAFETYLSTFANSGDIKDQIKALSDELANGNLSADEAAEKQAELALKQTELSAATKDVTSNWDFMQTAAMSTFHALESQGNSFIEIVGMMQGQLSTLGQMAADNGLQINEGLQAMTNTATFINQNEELAKRIEATRDMMEALGDSAFMTGNDFSSFASQTGLQFQDIMSKTTDQELALRLISPALADLIKYSESYGYTIDDNTQALIDQAREEGVLAEKKKTDQEITNDLLLSIAEVMGAKIPESLRRMSGEFSTTMNGIQDQTNRWGDSLSGVQGQLQNDLPDAVANLDSEYAKRMTGNTIVRETEKWATSLKEVQGILEKDLIAAAGNLDEGYAKVAENIKSYMEGLDEETIQQMVKNMSQFVRDAEIGIQNFGAYAATTGVILNAWETGAVSAQDASNAMGSSFNELLGKAKDLGIEGSKDMLMMMKNVKESGLEVGQIQEYVNKQLQSGVTAFGKYLGTFNQGPKIKEQMLGVMDKLDTATGPEREKLLAELDTLNGDMKTWKEDVRGNFDSMGTYAVGMFSSMIAEGATFIEAMQAMGPQLSELSEIVKLSGSEVSGPLKEMLDMQDFITQNETLATRISSTTEMLQSLGNSGYLTNEIFNTFQSDAQSQFDALMTKTDDATQAYQLMGPELAKLAWYSQQYGYELDSGTQSMIAQAQQHGVNMKSMIPPEEKMVALMESLVTVLGGEIPYAMESMKGKTEQAMKEMQGGTGEWKKELDEVQKKLTTGLPNAVTSLDATYSKAMTGNTIVKETNSWKHSLEDVEGILGRDLLETADSLDEKYKHVMGNIYEYLQKTSKEGYESSMSFDQMVTELDRLKNAHDQLALKKKRSDKENNMMDDYKRQIQELSEAIEETAPTLENFGKKFKEFQEQLSGDIGVNKGMIEIARGLREQGQSLEEIDDIVDKSLTAGSKGLASWVEALGPATKEIEEIKKLQEEYRELKAQKDLSADDLVKMDKLNQELSKRRLDAQQLLLSDQNALLDSQDLMVAYFHSLQAEGKSVSEIMSIMGESFDAIAGKSMTDLTEGIGVEMTDTFSQLYQLQQKMSGNESLVKGIEGLGEALSGMGDSMLYMSDETFSSFEKSAVTAFDKLSAAGFDQQQSLQLMAPLLKDLSDYSAEYGFSLSKSTQDMLDNAKESGLIREKQKSDTEKLIDVNEHLASVMDRMASSLENLGAISPFAAMADEADELQKKTERMNGYERLKKNAIKDISLKQSEIGLLNQRMELEGYESPKKAEEIKKQISTKQDEITSLMDRQMNFDKLYQQTKLEVEKLQKNYNQNLPGNGDYISASIGYHSVLSQDQWFRLRKGEQVDVWTPEETQRIAATPVSRLNLSDSRPVAGRGDIVFEHITIQSENGEETVKEFMTAIKGNKFGVQNLIRKVAQ